MANAKICDNCGSVLTLDASNGREDSAGEIAAWVTVGAAGTEFEACTRSCAAALLADGTPLAAAVDAHLAVISEAARTIAGDGEQG